jgi:hypothetical protein
VASRPARGVAVPSAAPSVRPSTATPAAASAAVPAAASSAVAPAAAAAVPAGGQLPVGRRSPAAAAAPAQRPEIIPNPFAAAEQVAAWKLLLGVVAMSGLGSALLIHLGRRDQRAMDALHLDLMLGIERKIPGGPQP